jgi:hypothetical protein
LPVEVVTPDDPAPNEAEAERALDAWVEMYVALIVRLDGWDVRTSDPAFPRASPRVPAPPAGNGSAGPA